MRGRLSSGLSDLDRSFFVAFMSGGIGLKGFGGGEIVLLNKVVNADFLMSIVATAFAFAVLSVAIVAVDDVLLLLLLLLMMMMLLLLLIFLLLLLWLLLLLFLLLP